MFLTPHSVAAVALTQAVTAPGLAFVIGFVSHFLLDLVPHGDDGLNKWILKKKGSRVRKIFYVACIDSLIGGSIFLLLWAVAPRFNFWVAASAALGSVLPDILWGLAELFPKSRILEHYKQKHHLWQGSVSDPLSLKWGMILQLFTLLVSLWFVLF